MRLSFAKSYLESQVTSRNKELQLISQTVDSKIESSMKHHRRADSLIRRIRDSRDESSTQGSPRIDEAFASANNLTEAEKRLVEALKGKIRTIFFANHKPGEQGQKKKKRKKIYQ